MFGQDWLLAVRQPVDDGEPDRPRRGPAPLPSGSGSSATNDDLGCALWAMLDVIVDGYFDVTDLVDERLDDIEEIVFGDRAPRRDPPGGVHAPPQPRAVPPGRGAAARGDRHASCAARSTGIGPESIVALAGRLRPLAAGRRPHRVAARPAHRPARGAPRGRVEPDERRDEEDVDYGAILLVSTLIAGIYGMNFRHMPELRLPLRLLVALGVDGDRDRRPLGAVQEAGLAVAPARVGTDGCVCAPPRIPSSSATQPADRDRRARSPRRRSTAATARRSRGRTGSPARRGTARPSRARGPPGTG